MNFDLIQSGLLCIEILILQQIQNMIAASLLYNYENLQEE